MTPQTLDTIAANSVAKRVVVCMAMEARDPNAVEVANALQVLSGVNLCRTFRENGYQVPWAVSERGGRGRETGRAAANLHSTMLQTEFAGRLGGFCYSLHPMIDGEVAGKSSNENWAARCVSKYLVDTLRVRES